MHAQMRCRKGTGMQSCHRASFMCTVRVFFFLLHLAFVWSGSTASRSSEETRYSSSPTGARSLNCLGAISKDASAALLSFGRMTTILISPSATCWWNSGMTICLLFFRFFPHDLAIIRHLLNVARQHRIHVLRELSCLVT